MSGQTFYIDPQTGEDSNNGLASSYPLKTYDTRTFSGGDTILFETEILYLFSTSNPGIFYSSIECALWGSRKMVEGKHHVIIENLVFKNGGVHGFIR